MELVTGRSGSPHITAQQDRQKHQGVFGTDAYILATGNQLEPVLQSSNKILVKDGALMYQGALFSVKVGTTDEITINNGNQGMQRKDLVVIRYTYDSAQQKESAEWAVLQGEPAASNPVSPTPTSGDIQNNDSVVECPVFIVNLNGINVTGVDVVPEVLPTIPELIGRIPGSWTQIYSANNNQIHVIKFGSIVFARFAIYMPDTTERTLTWNNQYAPIYGSGFAAHLERNGQIAGESWISRASDASNASGTLTYKAAQGNYGTYTGTVFWFTSPDVIEEEETNMLRAGNGIDITNNVISVESADEVSDGDTRPIESAAVYDAYGIEYKAGNGINISPDGVISVDTTGSVEDDNQSPVTSDGVYEVSKVAEQKLSEV